jgi:hypothetical protein
MQQLEPHTFNRNGTATDDDFVTVSLDEEPDEGFDTIRPSTARRRGCRFKNSQATPSRRPRIPSEWMGDGLGSNKDVRLSVESSFGNVGELTHGKRPARDAG